MASPWGGIRIPADLFRVVDGDWELRPERPAATAVPIGPGGPIWCHDNARPAVLAVDAAFHPEVSADFLECESGGVARLDWNSADGSWDLFRPLLEAPLAATLRASSPLSTVLIRGGAFCGRFLAIFTLLCFLWSRLRGRSLLPRLFAVVFAAAVLAGLFLSEPAVRFVDYDYHMSMAALARHGTPDFRPDDLAYLRERAPDKKASGLVVYQNSRAVPYGVHFWFWSLLCVPAYWLLEAFGVGLEWANALTLTLCFLAVSLVAAGRLALSPNRRFVFLALVSFSPYLWYVTLFGGSEGYVYCCLILAVTAASNRRFALAALALSFASMQLSVFAVIAVVYARYSLLLGGWTRRNALAAGASLLPALVSPVFYLFTFGKLSVIAGDFVRPLTAANLRMVMTMLFDPAQGLIVFMPLLVVALLYALGRALARVLAGARSGSAGRSPERWADLIVYSTPFAFGIGASVMINWHSGHNGLMRYALHFIPFAALAVARLDFPRAPRLPGWILAVSAALIAGWVTPSRSVPWMEYRTLSLSRFQDYMLPEADVIRAHYSVPLMAIMRHVPSLGHFWEDEMFVELVERNWFMRRSVKVPVGARYLPVVYYDRRYGIRKMFTDARALKEFADGFDFEDRDSRDRLLSYAGDDKDRHFYVNFPAFRKSGAVALRDFGSFDEIHGAMKISQWFDFASGALIVDVELPNPTGRPLLRVPQTMPKDNAVVLVGTLTESRSGKSMTVRKNLDRNIYPGESHRMTLDFKGANESGEYLVRIRLVQGEDDPAGGRELAFTFGEP